MAACGQSVTKTLGDFVTWFGVNFCLIFIFPLENVASDAPVFTLISGKTLVHVFLTS